MGVGILSAFVFLTDSRINSLFGQKNEPKGMINQDKQHGEGHQTATIQSHRSYEIEIVSNLDNISPRKSVKITYKIKNDKRDVVKNFDVVHEKIMHFITVRHDLQYFQHLHPEFNKQTGEFTVDATFPSDGPYRLFPDFTPTDENPQKLPITVSHEVEVGVMKRYKAQELTTDSKTKKAVNGYGLEYSFLSSNLSSQEEITFSLSIDSDGAPVTNLQPYLGALGHSVILKKDTLDFIHTHALEGKGTGPTIEFATEFPESGLYKIFTQFQHQGKVVTSDYVIKVN